MSKIEVKNVYKIFGDSPSKVLPMVQDGASKEEILEKTGHTVGLNNVSITIEEGETFVCMGLSGSGKSTLIRHINRLIDPTSGEIMVEGTNVMSLDKKNLIEFRRHKMSMVFQRFGLFPHKTVLENVGYGLEVQGQKPEERNKVAMEKIEAVGLNGFEHQYPNQLSGGMQQRVGLARALATNTDIMLMDEAFSALDPLIRSDMQKQLIDLQSKLKKTIVFITHDLDESLRLGDHIGILNGGKLVQVGTPIDIWEGVGSSREQDIDKLEVYYVDEKEITDYNSLWEITKSGWDSESEFVYPYIQVNGEWLRWDNQSLRMDMGIYVWTKENQQKYIGVMLTGGFDDERIVMKNPMTSNGIKIGRNQPLICKVTLIKHQIN